MFIAHSPRGFDPANPSAFKGDPAASFGGNVVRVKDGKILEWWFTGGGGAAPGAAAGNPPAVPSGGLPPGPAPPAPPDRSRLGVRRRTGIAGLLC